MLPIPAWAIATSMLSIPEMLKQQTCICHEWHAIWRSENLNESAACLWFYMCNPALVSFGWRLWARDERWRFALGSQVSRQARRDYIMKIWQGLDYLFWAGVVSAGCETVGPLLCPIIDLRQLNQSLRSSCKRVDFATYSRFWYKYIILISAVKRLIALIS